MQEKGKAKQQRNEKSSLSVYKCRKKEKRGENVRADLTDGISPPPSRERRQVQLAPENTCAGVQLENVSTINVWTQIQSFSPGAYISNINAMHQLHDSAIHAEKMLIKTSNLKMQMHENRWK